jgi:hypothetical protein
VNFDGVQTQLAVHIALVGSISATTATQDGLHFFPLEAPKRLRGSDFPPCPKSLPIPAELDEVGALHDFVGSPEP